MPSEHRAVLILLALALAGHGARLVLLRPGDAPGGLRVLGAGASASPAAHRDSALRLASPLAAGERIDVDRASARELTRLPRVGPALARKIVADREANGPFGSPEGLDRVAGVGEGLLRGLEGKVSFSGSPRSAPPAPDAPGTGPQPATGAPSRPPAVPPSRRLDLNTATAGELDALPGIGPAKARAIVAYREAHGRFASVDAVAGVPGIGPALTVRIRDALVVR